MKTHQMRVLSTHHRRNLKTQQKQLILDLCLRKTRSAKSRDHRDVIVFLAREHEKLSFSYSLGLRAISKSSVFVAIIVKVLLKCKESSLAIID